MISFFERRSPPKSLHPDIRQIAETTLIHRQSQWVYYDGLIDEVVRRCDGKSGNEEIIDTIEATFREYEWGARPVYEALAAQFGIAA